MQYFPHPSQRTWFQASITKKRLKKITVYAIKVLQFIKAFTRGNWYFVVVVGYLRFKKSLNVEQRDQTKGLDLLVMALM